MILLVTSIFETLGELGNVVVAVSSALSLVSLGIVSTDEDALGSLDSAGTSVFTLQVSGLFVFIEGNDDILDAIDSNAGLAGDLSLGFEGYN